MRLMVPVLLGVLIGVSGCAVREPADEPSPVQATSGSPQPSVRADSGMTPLLMLDSPSERLPQGWQPWVLHPAKARTQYRVVQDPEAGAVVSARADSSASGLAREIRLDLTQTPFIEWKWRVDSLIAGADNTDRYAEDSPARIVLAFDGDKQSLPMRERLFFEQARLLSGRDMPYATLMYIWENRQPVGTVLQNPHTARVRKVVAESGADGVGRWQRYRRNVIEDFISAYGKPPGPLIGIAILTDSDNTRQRVSAQYGPIRLTPADFLPPAGGTRAQVP